MLMTADNGGTGCDIHACFLKCKTSAFASTEQVQSKIVLLEDKNLHFDWCLFGASNKDGADFETGTDLVMNFIWWRLLFRCKDLFS